jgi:hypothetical protein
MVLQKWLLWAVVVWMAVETITESLFAAAAPPLHPCLVWISVLDAGA